MGEGDNVEVEKGDGGEVEEEVNVEVKKGYG